MIQGKTSFSIHTDSFQAGKEAASKLAASLKDVQVIFTYMSEKYNGAEAIKGIKEIFPNAPVVGNTSNGAIITNDGIIDAAGGFIGLLALSADDLEVSVAASQSLDIPRNTGRIVAEKALAKTKHGKKPDYILMAATPGTEEEFIKGIADILGNVPIFGGSAADDGMTGAWSVYADEEIASNGLSIACIYTPHKIYNEFTGAYRETDDVGIITKVVDDRVLMTIDGETALEKYATWTDSKLEDILGGNLLVKTITSPLGVKDRLGDLIAIRHPMNGNDDLSMNVGANLAEKTAIIRMEASVDELIAAVSTTLDELLAQSKTKPKALHLVHCGGRKIGIGDKINQVEQILHDKLGDIPYIMEFTFGEYGFVNNGRNTVGGLMLSFTAIT